MNRCMVAFSIATLVVVSVAVWMLKRGSDIPVTTGSDFNHNVSPRNATKAEDAERTTARTEPHPPEESRGSAFQPRPAATGTTGNFIGDAPQCEKCVVMAAVRA
jgi:hypothetical protein